MTAPESFRDRLHAELDRAVHRRRLARRGAIGAAFGAIAIVLAIRLVGPAATPANQLIARSPHDPAATGAHPSDASSPMPPTANKTTNTAVTVRRWATADAPPVRRINDDELLAQLSAIDQPSGLVEYRGRTHLIRLSSRE
jgi:hypothetical protein